MTILNKTLFFFCLCLFIQINLFGQNEEWKQQFSDDGKIEVLSKFSKERNADGEEFQVIEYVSSMIIDYPLEDCLAIIKNVDNHKEFYSDTETSDKIKEISDTECLVYFYIDSPWPLPNSDCVSIMTFSENLEEGSAQFNLIAHPNEMEMKDVKRMTFSETVYSFKRTKDQKILFEMKSKFSPVVNAPTWLVKSWFPDGPVEIMENIELLIQSI